MASASSVASNPRLLAADPLKAKRDEWLTADPRPPMPCPLAAEPGSEEQQQQLLMEQQQLLMEQQQQQNMMSMQLQQPPAPMSGADAAREQAIAELNEVLESSQFKSFAEFCSTSGQFVLPFDAPRIASSFIEVSACRHPASSSSPLLLASSPLASSSLLFLLPLPSPG